MRTLLVTLFALTATGASAQVIAEARSADGARVVLHEGAGPCVGKARLAEYVPPSGPAVVGCWLATPSHITLAYLDGESGKVPVADLRRPFQAPQAEVPAARPAPPAATTLPANAI